MITRNALLLTTALFLAYPAITHAEEIHAGDYLASRFAQNNHDWNNASTYLDNLLDDQTVSQEKLQRAMVLAMGSGRGDEAIRMAKKLKKNDWPGSQTLLDIFLIIDSFKNQDYKKSSEIFTALEQNGTTKFLGPYMQGWIAAAQNKVDLKPLQSNISQLYHGILISDHLNDHSEIEKLIDKASSVETINVAELERIADLYGHIGNTDKAKELYQRILKKRPEEKAIQNKITALENGKSSDLFERIKTPQQGMAQAFHDMTGILVNENNDESARVFANIALHLYPKMSKTRLLLGSLHQEHEQYDAAIKQYEAVEKNSPDYLKSRHAIADIYMNTEQFDLAVALLKKVYKHDKDIGTLIKIGDAQRRQSNFGLALKEYNKAVKALGGKVPKEYWHLHYVRGIAYEQSNNWKRAEEELQAALAYQPEHPYVLNYLGYAWADQGKNLDEARAMIQKAVSLRPSDGYITDSLGWVIYRMADYEAAAEVLERAVELLPYDPTINDHLGDAYWQVGRKREARFQWERAVNHSEDQDQVQTIQGKLSDGLIK